MAVSRIVVFTAVIAVMLPMAAIISNAPSADAAAAKAFNFTEFLGGHWTVEIRTVTPGSPKSVADDSDELGADNEVTLGNYILHKKPPSFLEGVYYENITNSPSDIKNALRVRVDCSSGSAGVFKTARAETDIFEESLEDEPELQFRTLFEFDFQAHKNGMQVSSGEWHGRKKGIYQFAVASPSTFVLSVYPKGPTEKDEPFTMQTMTGQKEVIKSFWETYGFQLVLIGMIIVPRLFLSAGGRRSFAAPKPAVQAAGAQAAAGAKKKD